MQPQMKEESPKESTRFCVKYREMNRETKKSRVFHNFFNATDEAGAEAEFWKTPTWKPPIQKIEIVSIDKV